MRSVKSWSRGDIYTFLFGGGLKGSGSVTKAFAMVNVILKKKTTTGTHHLSVTHF
jgi:hypothetical protein